MIIAGIAICLVSRIFLRPLITAFGATEYVMDYAMTYVGITSLGMPFFVLTTGGSHLIRADGKPAFSMMIALSGAIINTILDPLFIFVFKWGMGYYHRTVFLSNVSAWLFAKIPYSKAFAA